MTFKDEIILDSSLSKSGVKSSKKVSSEISSLSILSRSFYGANLPNNHETKSLTSPRLVDFDLC